MIIVSNNIRCARICIV